MKSVLDYLSSVKLAIVLLIIITLASILGTLVPQQRAAAEYTARYGQLAPLLITLEVTKLYHSWWFLGLLFFFSLNIAVCTLTRLGSKWRRAFRPRLEADAKKLKALKISAEFRMQGAPADAAPIVKSALAGRRYRVHESGREGNIDLVARKRIAGLFGSDIVHLGLLVILIGGIISGFNSTRRMLTITEGATLDIPEAGIQLRLDKFQTDYYPNGSVKDWRSFLTVIQSGQEVLQKPIEVNHPLSYRGFLFYQSSYGYDWENPRFEIWAKKADDSEFLDKLQTGVGETVRLSDEKTEIVIKNFVPDFMINEQNQISTRSLQPNNPAVLIEGRQDGEQLFAAWVFSKYPDFSQMHSEREHEFTFELKNIDSAPYSGIEMARDPGANFIWAGCILLTLGLFVAFFWPPAEIRVALVQDQDRTSITAGGIAAKNKDALQEEFDRITASLRSQP
jgi:cytochrome c biogenesis protein